MKPRLCTAIYTEEDVDIIRRIGRGDIYRWACHFGLYNAADRRDADLVLALRRWGFIRRTEAGTLFNLDPPRYL